MPSKLNKKKQPPKKTTDQPSSCLQNTKTHPNQSEAVNFQNGVKKYVNIPSEKKIYVHKYVYICVYTYLCKMDEYRYYAGLS